ncbi:MAG TPA: hypothetical protein VIX91_24260, partial [Candidatus Acidoferrum sp.]
NPLVGRDVSVGILFGLLLTCLGFVRHAAPAWLLSAAPIPSVGTQFAGSLPAFVGQILVRCSGNIMNSIGSIAILFLGWKLTRNRIVSASILAAFWSVVSLTGTNHIVDIPVALSLGILLTLCLVRAGYFPLIVALVVYGVANAFPLTLDFDRWYAGRSAFMLLLLLGLAAYGFRVSLGSRSLFSSADD